jgi:hypothetical protein
MWIANEQTVRVTASFATFTLPIHVFIVPFDNGSFELKHVAEINIQTRCIITIHFV